MKRKARDISDQSKGQLSAFAAARRAKQAREETAFDVDENNAVLNSLSDISPNEQNAIDRADGSPGENEDNRNPAQRGEPPIQLSTINLNANRLADSEGDILELDIRVGETVAILGEYSISVLSGAVGVYGAILRAHDPALKSVCAPSIHALPQMVGLEPNTRLNLVGTNRLHSLERLSPLFRNIWPVNAEWGSSFAILASSEDDSLKRSFSVLEIDNGSKLVLSRLRARNKRKDSRLIVMAIGSKSAGKSTFNRFVCNSMLGTDINQKCLYLDLDPGQPEFAPPGQISLVEVTCPVMGPSFAHPAHQSYKVFQLLRSHTLAASSFRDDPDHYLACVADLFRHASRNHEARSLPLVVNACGWISGVGAGVQIQIANEIGVTDVVQLGSVGEELGDSLAALHCTIHQVPRQATRPSVRTPAELRAMQTMAYFHHEPDNGRGSVVHFVDKSISTFRPWEVLYDATPQGVHAIMSYGHHPSPEYLIEVLDGSIVALVLVEESYAETLSVARTPTGRLPYVEANEEGMCAPLDPQHSRCIGLALIRAIDTTTKSLMLITPVLRAQIEDVGNEKVVLVRGSFDSPDWAYLEDLYEGREKKPWCLGEKITENGPWISRKARVGVESSVWRLRHPPAPSAVHR